MKKNRFIKHRSCLSLMAILPTMFGPTLMMQPVEARVMQASGGGDLNSLLETVWTDAWGLQYVAGDSGLNLKDFGGLPGLWTVEVVEDHHLNYTDINLTEAEINAQFVASGVLEESARFALPVLTPSPQVLAENGIISMNFAIIAGTMVGSTGYSTGVFGLEQSIEVPTGEFDELVQLSRSFTPFGVTIDAASAATEAGILAFDLNPAALQTAPVGDRLPGYESCADAYNGCMSACNSVLAAMLVVCLLAAPATLVTCLSKCSFLLWIPFVREPCMAICVAAAAAVLAGCIYGAWAWYKGCKHGCRVALTNCSDDAIIKVLEDLMALLFPGSSSGNPQPLPPQTE